MSEQENIKVVQAIVEMVLTNQLQRTPEFFHEDYTADVPGSSGLSREQAQQWTQSFMDAFPDLQLEGTHFVAQGDEVVLMATMSGTNTKPLPLPLPTGGTTAPTGRRITTPICYSYTLRNGKVARAYGYMDRADILDQLGLLPSIERAREAGA